MDSIRVDEKNKVFTIDTLNTTYQFKVDQYGFLLHLYYGRRIEGVMDYLITCRDRGFSANPYCAGNDRTYSLDALPQEFPTMGTGDFRSVALEVENSDGSYATDLRYQGFRIEKGKYSLPGLPAVYAPEREAMTLEVDLKDEVSGLSVTLLYGVLPGKDIITRTLKVTNGEDGRIYIGKIQSAVLDFLYGRYDLISFNGRHAMERNAQRCAITHETQVISSRRGASSHQFNPLMIIADERADEMTGEAYALSFVYSGNFKGEALKDQYDQTRVLLGLGDELLRYPLERNEVFYAPEVIMTFSSCGLSTLSHNLHSCIRENIIRGEYKQTRGPVLINSWEAAYFDFTGETIIKLAREAKELGIELLVMDDGWFGKRDDDCSGLGDWVVNEKKLGMPLSVLCRKINELGLKFGIWVEPEMVSEDSDLYRAHPDWALAIPGRKPVRGRYQLMLDFSRREVRDHVFSSISQVLDQCNVEYLKWDMNRQLIDIFSLQTKDQGRVMHDFTLGVYEFLERLREKYPHLLVEGCSGGGGRFDAGMLFYTPQIWTSDNTDAIDRIRIQYGTSFGYPIATMGSHVSAVPNHQTGRIVSMKTRAVTAMSGTFGYELDLGKLTQEEKTEIKEQVKTYKEYAPLIREGLYYRLTDPFSEGVAAWLFVEKEKSRALLNAVMLEIHGNMTDNYIRLQGLEESALYKETSTGITYTGGALMHAGFPLPVKTGAYQGYQFCFEKLE